MNWFKKILLTVTMINMVVSPVVAQTTSPRATYQQRYKKSKVTRQNLPQRKSQPANQNSSPTNQSVKRTPLKPAEVFYNSPDFNYKSFNIDLATKVSKGPKWSMQDKIQLAKYRDYLEPLGYRIALDPNSKKALVYGKDNNDLVMEIPFAEEEKLRKFSPKTLNRMLLDEMVHVKSASKAS